MNKQFNALHYCENRQTAWMQFPPLHPYTFRIQKAYETQTPPFVFLCMDIKSRPRISPMIGFCSRV